MKIQSVFVRTKVQMNRHLDMKLVHFRSIIIAKSVPSPSNGYIATNKSVLKLISCRYMANDWFYSPGSNLKRGMECILSSSAVTMVIKIDLTGQW